MTLIKDIWCVGHLKGSGCKPVLNSLIYIMIHAIPYNIDAFSISQLPILNILCCLLSTKCTATLLKDRFNGEYYKILQETTKPFVKKHSVFIEQERNQKSECLLNKVGLFVSLTRFICLLDRICLYVQGSKFAKKNTCAWRKLG